MRESNYDILDEFEKVKMQIYCANNEFNNVTQKLQIQAVIFRMNELESRRDLILKQIKEMGE